MRSLRIGLLTNVFLPDQNGVSTSVLLLQRELRRRGHRAVIVAPRFPDYLDPATLHGVVRLPSMVHPALPRQRLAFPTRRRLSGQFDLVHTHTPGAIGFWGARLARRWDIPHVSTFHTHLEHYAHYIPGLTTLEKHAGVLTRIVRRFYTKADLIVAPTEASRDMLAGVRGLPPQRGAAHWHRRIAAPGGLPGVFSLAHWQAAAPERGAAGP